MQSTTESPRHRRSPTASDLLIWRTFIETSEQVKSEIGARLTSQSGISAGDYVVLLALSEAEAKRLRSSDLADRIDWERSRLSHHLGRMERRGLIVRVECETDSRGAEIILSADGADVFRRASAPHLQAIQQLFVDALTRDQLNALDDAVRALRDHHDRS